MYTFDAYITLNVFCVIFRSDFMLDLKIEYLDAVYICNISIFFTLAESSHTLSQALFLSYCPLVFPDV